MFLCLGCLGGSITSGNNPPKIAKNKPIISLLVKGGLKNIIRYSLDFISLEGFPPQFNGIQKMMKALPERICNLLGINLVDEYYSDTPFKYTAHVRSSEITSFWGLWGFLFILPVFLPCLMGSLYLTYVELLSSIFYLEGIGNS